MANKKLLEVKNLNKVFRNKNVIVKAIDNASFEVKQGEVVGLIGESGSGKTTIGRTIIGLHNATSGTIQFGNKDITNSKSKKVKKMITKNIQMIFQDPYSSLNSQKNVLSIVSEPIIANKLWKSTLNDTIKNRKTILKYYKYSLIAKYWKEFNEYRIYANREAFKFEKSLNLKLQRFNVDLNESQEVNVNAIINLFYRDRFDINAKILDKLVKTEESLFKQWTIFNSNIKKTKNIPSDEKKLLTITNEIKETKKLIYESHKATKIKKRISNKKASLKKLLIEFSETKKLAEANFKKINVLTKNNIKASRASKRLSKTNKLYKFYNDQLISAKAKQKFLLKLKRKIKRPTDCNVEKVTKFLQSDFSSEAKREDFIFEMVGINTQVRRYYKTNIYNLKSDIAKNISLLNTELDNERKEERLEFARKLDQLKLDQKEATIEFQKETNIFLEKFNIDQVIAKKNATEKIDKYLKEYLKIRKQNKKLFSKVLSKINESFKGVQLTTRQVKKMISKEEIKNVALEIEIKNIKKNIKIVKILYSLILKPTIWIRLLLKRLIIRNKVYEALRHSGLKTSYAYRYPHEFSGGMRQRVGIARAIISRPKLIIADEPIAALDLSIQAQIVNMLLNQRDRLNLAMIFIAHDLSMVRFNSDRVLIMHHGKIVEYGDTDLIFKNPKHPYTKNLISSMPSIKKSRRGIQVSTFKSTYLESYTPTNQPVYHEVKKGHFVLATKGQMEKWK